MFHVVIRLIHARYAVEKKKHVLQFIYKVSLRYALSLRITKCICLSVLDDGPIESCNVGNKEQWINSSIKWKNDSEIEVILFSL